MRKSILAAALVLMAGCSCIALGVAGANARAKDTEPSYAADSRLPEIGTVGRTALTEAAAELQDAKSNEGRSTKQEEEPTQLSASNKPTVQASEQEESAVQTVPEIKDERAGKEIAAETEPEQKRQGEETSEPVQEPRGEETSELSQEQSGKQEAVPTQAPVQEAVKVPEPVIENTDESVRETAEIVPETVPAQVPETVAEKVAEAENPAQAAPADTSLEEETAEPRTQIIRSAYCLYNEVRQAGLAEEDFDKKERYPVFCLSSFEEAEQLLAGFSVKTDLPEEYGKAFFDTYDLYAVWKHTGSSDYLTEEFQLSCREDGGTLYISIDLQPVARISRSCDMAGWWILVPYPKDGSVNVCYAGTGKSFE